MIGLGSFHAYFVISTFLEVLLQGLYDSEIRCGIQNEPPAGGITAWIDYGSRTEKATFYGTIVGDRQVGRRPHRCVDA